MPNRSQQRKQVSYGWVKTVREAGELYRDTEDIKAVTDNLDISEKKTRDALTVYRLIFENQPENVSRRVYPVGRAFFSLNEEVGSAIDEKETDPVEHLLREFVGSVHLEYDIAEEPVGDPVELTSLPKLTGFDELGKQLAGLITYPMAPIMANKMLPMIEQRNIMASTITESILTPQQEMMKTLASATNPLISHQIQRYQNIFNFLEINFFEGIPIPGPVLVDLASIQPTISATAATPATSSISKTVVSETTTVEHEPTETDPIEPLPVSLFNITLDSTLPNPNEITTELISEIPPMIAQAILSPPDVRVWFSNRSKEYQDAFVKLLIIIVTLEFTTELAVVSIAIQFSGLIRRTITGEEEDE